MNLPDPRDIDRVLFRGREKFDLGFTCDCQRGWCALMNNPEGMQNPGVSTALLGLADRGVRLAVVTVFLPHLCSAAPPQQPRWERRGVGGVWGERKS